MRLYTLKQSRTVWLLPNNDQALQVKHGNDWTDSGLIGSRPPVAYRSAFAAAFAFLDLLAALSPLLYSGSGQTPQRGAAEC